MYLIKKVSKMSGVSVRALHHYDEIGLLCPQKKENSYRYYTEKDMSVLQTILFYKYLGFSLKQIRILLDKEDQDLLIHLKAQLDLMNEEKTRLLTLITTLENTINSKERRMQMSIEEKFKGFVYKDNQKYIQEAMYKYGKEVVEKSLDKQRGNEEQLITGFNRIFSSFSENKLKGILANSKANVELSRELHQHICKHSFDCSNEVFLNIGLGYVKNEEFRRNIDKFGKGTSEYVYEAILEYAKENKEKNC